MKTNLNFILLLFVFVSCKTIPEYSNTPEISFGNTQVIENIFDSLSLSSTDSVIFTINFKDGDGDLGLSQSQIQTDTTPNSYLTEYRLSNGIWQQSATSKEQFGLLLEENISSPIDGELYISKSFLHAIYFKTNDTLKYSFRIRDRAGNFSNTIKSTEFVIHKK